MKPTLGRFLLGAWLLALLAGCSLLRPYRIPNPTTPPDVVAKRKAKAKAAKEGGKKKAATPATDADTGPTDDASIGAADVAAAPADTAGKAPASKAKKLKYNKHLLVKKPKYRRRQLHHPPTFTLRQRISNFFKFAFRGKPQYDKKPGAKPADPATAPADAPAATPDFPAGN